MAQGRSEYSCPNVNDCFCLVMVTGCTDIGAIDMSWIMICQQTYRMCMQN